MARLMVIEAITKAVVAGADYREMALCDNFYTPRVRPDVAWDLKEMVETISNLSIEIGVPFISGKDSSSGTMQSGDRRIEVPHTLAVATLGRVPDVKKVVTKEFKRSGNKIVLVGRHDTRALGASVYADSFSQRGDRLFDAYDGASARGVWDALLRLHSVEGCVSGSAVAEGGILLRVFEASFGSGLGARVDIPAVERKDGFLFGEFIGSVLLEVTPDCDTGRTFEGIPHLVIGEVTQEPKLRLTAGREALWEESISELTGAWSQTMREVVE